MNVDKIIRNCCGCNSCGDLPSPWNEGVLPGLPDLRAFLKYKSNKGNVIPQGIKIEVF